MNKPLEKIVEKGKDCLAIGICCTFIGFVGYGAVGIIADICGGIGTKKTTEIYTFQYQGKPASLQKEDKVLGLSRYYIMLNKKEKLTGKIVSDDGKLIETVEGARNYKIQDSK